MEFILLICIFFLVLFFIVSKKSYKTKNILVTKEKIIQTYENELKEILSASDDKKQKMQQKKLFLQKCNNELSRNIFFTEKEAIQVIQRLSKI
ncbi:MAG: hypothetical protein WA945_01245 [Arcobacteraceae bacterium]